MDLEGLVRNTLTNAAWSLYDIQELFDEVYILRNACSARWRGQLHKPGRESNLLYTELLLLRSGWGLGGQVIRNHRANGGD